MASGLLSGVVEVGLVSGKDFPSNGRQTYVVLNCGPHEQAVSKLGEGKASDPVFNQVHTLCVTPSAPELSLWVWCKNAAGMPDESIGWSRIPLMDKFRGAQQPVQVPQMPYPVTGKTTCQKIGEITMSFAFTPGQFDRAAGPGPANYSSPGPIYMKKGSGGGRGSLFKSLLSGVGGVASIMLPMAGSLLPLVTGGASMGLDSMAMPDLQSAFDPGMYSAPAMASFGGQPDSGSLQDYLNAAMQQNNAELQQFFATMAGASYGAGSVPFYTQHPNPNSNPSATYTPMNWTRRNTF